MSEKSATIIDPSLTTGNQLDYRDVNLKSPEILDLLKEKGEIFLRKIEPIKGFRDPETNEVIDTIVNDMVESSQVAEPGKHKIILGSHDEEFVLTTEKFNSLYEKNESGSYVPKERRILVMQNPFGEPIRIEAPWSTPDNPQTASGSEEAIIAFELDKKGQLTDDRYLIGNKDLLLANYDPMFDSTKIQDES